MLYSNATTLSDESTRSTPQAIETVLVFAGDKLRSIRFIMDYGVSDFATIIQGGKKILGPLNSGTDMDTIRKFDAGIIDQVIVGWRDTGLKM